MGIVCTGRDDRIGCAIFNWVQERKLRAGLQSGLKSHDPMRDGGIPFNAEAVLDDEDTEGAIDSGVCEY